MIARLIPMLVACFPLMSCGKDKPEIRACEAYIKVIIDAPATYKRASVSSFENAKGGRPILTVLVNYDAANTYGVPIRNMQACDFAIENGKVDTNGYEEGRLVQLRGAMHKLDKATGQDMTDDCCL